MAFMAIFWWLLSKIGTGSLMAFMAIFRWLLSKIGEGIATAITDAGADFYREPLVRMFTTIHGHANTLITKASEALWEMFLPSGYRENIETSPSFKNKKNYTKKELYFHLCKFPILLEGGTESFKIDAKSGRNCYMLGARALSITHTGDPQCLKWNSHTDPRFPEVAELVNVQLLEIQVRMNTKMLSPKTAYIAYLVFDFAHESNGLESITVKASLSTNLDGDQSRIVCHQSKASPHMPIATEDLLPHKRKDGWMEVEIGEFGGEEGVNQLATEEAQNQSGILSGRSGLILQGIELRPKTENSFRWTIFKWLFKSTVEYVTACENFAPSDYKDIIASAVKRTGNSSYRSVRPTDYSSRIELYDHLCKYILRERTSHRSWMSFTLDPKSGKRSLILAPSALYFSSGDKKEKWQWTSRWSKSSHAQTSSAVQSRFRSVAILLKIDRLRIRGTIETQLLSPGTMYAAYLIFRIGEESDGLCGPFKAYHRYVDQAKNEAKERTVHLKAEETSTSSSSSSSSCPRKRAGGWMEIELGEFFVDQDDNRQMKMTLKETVKNKSGLIIEGMEVRPKER